MRRKYVNLLPPVEQKENKFYHIGQDLAHFGMWLVLSLVVLGLLLFAAQLLLKRTLTETASITEAKTRELEQLEESFFQEDVVSLNTDLKNFQKLSSEHKEWSEVIVELGRLLPRDLTVDSVLLTRDDNKVELMGRAGIRDSVLAFRRNLINSPFFVNVNFPLTNLEKPVNTEWHYRLFISPEVWK